MKNILDDLFYARLRPFEMDFSSNDYDQAVNLLIKEEDAINSRLSKDEKALLEQFADAQRSVNELTALEYFKLGFKLGANFQSVINDGNDILEKIISK